MTIHKRLWSGAFLALCLTLASCGNGQDEREASVEEDSAAQEPEAETELRVGFGSQPQTLDWHLHGDPAAELVLWSVNEALVELTADGGVRPSLAASVPVVDPEQPDRWRVELREGVTFTNGEPLNAEAVKANVDRVADPDFETITSGYERLAGAEVISDYTVDVITDGPDPFFLSRLPELRILPPEAMEDPGFAEHPIGTGPYVFDRWDKSGNRITLKANPDYWGQQGSSETIHIRIIDDESTRVSALETGEIDMAPIAPDQADQVPQVIRGGAAAESGAIRFNLAREPYSDVRFRQALNYAVDKEAINDAIFSGLFDVSACQSLPEGAFGFNPDLEPYPYDPDKARSLLAEVDIPDDFVLEFEGTSGFWVRDREVQEAMASYWEDIGLEVDLGINSEDAYLDKLFMGDDSPGIVYMELDHRFTHGARIIDRQLNRDGAIATIGDQFPEVDGLIAATQTFDEEASLEAFHELFRIGCEEAVLVFTLDRFDLWGAADGVDYAPVGTGIHRLDFHRVTREP